MTSSGRRPRSPLALCGLVAIIASAPYVLRLVYEETILTWREGDQMVGFSVVHAFPQLLLLGGLGLLGVHLFLLAWLGSSAFELFRRRKLPSHHLLLVATATAMLLAFYLPYAGWMTLLVRIVGPGDHGDSFLSFAAAEHHPVLAKTLLQEGVPVDSDFNGHTALNTACVRKDVPLARFLLSNGAALKKAPECRRIPEITGGPRPIVVPGESIEVQP